MIKRLVILQDEELVIREMHRVPRVPSRRRPTPWPVRRPRRPPAPASMVALADPVDAAEPIDDEAAPGSQRPRPPRRGRRGPSKLADIAKAAALNAERAVIKETLQQVQWNRRRAAGQLGVSYKTLLNKIKECGINPK